MEILKNIPVWFYIVPVIMVLYFVGYLFYVKKSRNKKQDFLDANPTASTVYCQVGQRGIKTVEVSIISIDGGHSYSHFNEGTKIAYMLLPGTHIIEATASSTRPGVMHKTVTETFGPVKLELEVGTSTSYTLGFDTKTNEFTFVEN